uniref:Uncharacterized protein n=1 Tax=Glossina palpalis gambiensis TaxID=67801 RepID=A0A1B0AXI2_9MUSC
MDHWIDPLISKGAPGNLKRLIYRMLKLTSSSEQLHSPVREASQSAAYQDDTDTWTIDKRDPPQFEFGGNYGPINLDEVKSSGDFFNMFLKESFLIKIVQ